MLLFMNQVTILMTINQYFIADIFLAEIMLAISVIMGIMKVVLKGELLWNKLDKIYVI